MTYDETIRWLSRIKADLQSMNRHSSPDELKSLDIAIAELMGIEPPTAEDAARSAVEDLSLHVRDMIRKTKERPAAPGKAIDHSEQALDMVTQ